MRDTFFEVSYCERCGGPLHARIMSWFENKAICIDCLKEEDMIKKRLKEEGKNPADYEGCGYIPK